MRPKNINILAGAALAVAQLHESCPDSRELEFCATYMH